VVLSGRPTVVVGAGPVGRCIGGLLRAIGLTTTAVCRRARPIVEFDQVVAMHEMYAVPPMASVLVVALPLTIETAGMIDRRTLDLLPADAFLINVARGGIVDEPALIDALTSGRHAGAARDTVDQEPLPPGHRVWRCSRVLLTAHIAWTTPSYERDLVALLVENVRRVEAGLAPHNLVSPSGPGRGDPGQ
jgi:glyoxylate/hydroxypyruvate reductase